MISKTLHSQEIQRFGLCAWHGIITRGLYAQSAGTPLSGLHSAQASQGLGIPPPTYEYPVTINPAITPVTPPTPVGSSTRYSGGLPEVFFPLGTPPGSVGPPKPCP